MNEMVTIKNDGKKDWTIRWDSREYIIPAGKALMVDEYIARYYFGDARITDELEMAREAQRIEFLGGVPRGVFVVEWVPEDDEEEVVEEAPAKAVAPKKAPVAKKK